MVETQLADVIANLFARFDTLVNATTANHVVPVFRGDVLEWGGTTRVSD